ncbi:MAG: cytochrome C oxidase subunit IV family protein, partial [Elusimicrobia bacterium]|nr:cytochrome C oxidase subunit IV family protein [Elusimicrobiota bacterium]
MNDAAAPHGHPPPNVKLYMMIFAALMALTVLTVLVSYLHLPRSLGIPAGLLIAAVKGGLVAAFFMHLKGEHKLIYACLGILLFCALGFCLMPLDVHLVRQESLHAPVAAQV